MTTNLARSAPFLLLCSLLGAALGWADQPPPAKPKLNPAPAPAPAPTALATRNTIKVEKGPLETTVTVKGTFAAEKQAEIKVRLKSWTGSLVVENVVPHGTIVKKGDVLLRFDAEKLERLVRETREDRQTAGLAIQLAELELKQLRQNSPLDLQAAGRLKNETRADLKRFLEIDKDLEKKSAEFGLKGAEFSVEYARDELAQLEKMYHDKDLTEETERMILKRYQHTLAAREQQLEVAKNDTDRTLKTSLPRREEAAKLTSIRAELAHEKIRAELPIKIRQKELQLLKLVHDERGAKEKLADLEHDLAQMTVKSPAEGLVYFGRVVRGKATGPTAETFFPGGMLPPNQVVMTVIGRDGLVLVVEVEETEVGAIAVGQTVRVTPTVTPRNKLNGKVVAVQRVPQAGKYEARIAANNVPSDLVTGMTATARITTQRKDAALWVRGSAVFEDAEQESHYVYLPRDKPIRKTVKIGMVVGDKTEIVDGLKLGDEILSNKP